MKTTELNKIQNTQNAEIAAKEAAKAKLTEEEILAAVKPEGILDLLDRVYKDEVRMVTDNNDNIVNYNISKATGVKIVKVVNGQYVAAASEEELAAEALEQKKFNKAYTGKPVMDWLFVCLCLKAGNYRPDDVVEVGKQLIFVLADQKKAIGQEGNTVIDLSEKIVKGTPKEMVVEMIKDKIQIELSAKLITEAERKAKLADQKRKEAEHEADLARRSAESNYRELVAERNRKAAQTVARTVVTNTDTDGDLPVGIQIEVDLGRNGHCSIVVGESLRTCSLKDAILYGLKANKDLIGMTRGTNPIVKGAEFIADRIKSNSPIEATSMNELHEKVAMIVYMALKDSPIVGFNYGTARGGADSSYAQEMARKIATIILANSIIA